MRPAHQASFRQATIGAAKRRMDVTNSLPQASQDQAWSIRPRMLKLDSSAMRSTLPQCGQLGRPRLSGARPRVEKTRQAGWAIIDPPQRSPPVPSSILSHPVRPLWRHGDTGVKLSWRGSQLQRAEMVASMVPRAGANASRSGRNWCGRTSSNPRACCWHRVRGPRTSRPQTKGQRRRAPQAARADYRRRDCQPPYSFCRFGLWNIFRVTEPARFRLF